MSNGLQTQGNWGFKDQRKYDDEGGDDEDVYWGRRSEKGERA